MGLPNNLYQTQSDQQAGFVDHEINKTGGTVRRKSLNNLSRDSKADQANGNDPKAEPVQQQRPADRRAGEEPAKMSKRVVFEVIFKI